MRTISSFILFYSLASYFLLFFALTGKIHVATVASPCILTLLLFLVFNVKYLKGFVGGFSKKIVAGTLLLFLIPLFHILFIPPFLRDDIIYHLAVPKAIVNAGSFLMDPYNINANFPLLFEMPLVAFEYIKNWVSPFAVNLVMLIMLVSASFVFMRKHCKVDKKWAVVAAICILYTPLLYDQLHSCYVEIFFTLLIVTGFSEYLDYKKNSINTGAWIRAVLFIGLSCAVKYFGLVYLLFIFTYEFFTGKRRALMYSGLLAAILVCIPWYLKNWICLGNPFYPMLNRLFPSEFLTLVRTEHFNSLANSYHYGRSLIDYLLVPVRIFTGYSQSVKLGMLGFGGAVSIFYALSLFLSFKNPKNRILSILFFCYGIIWVFTSQQIRFLFPVLLLSSFVGLEKFCELFNKKRLVIWLFFSLAFLQSLFLIVKSMNNDRITDLITGNISKGQFLAFHMTYSYDVAEYVNKNLNSSSDRILTMGIFGRTYYFDVPTITVTYYDEVPFDRAFYKKDVNVAGLDSFLNKEKVSYILINRQFFFNQERLNAPIDFEAMQHYFDEKTELVYQKGAVVLLKRK
jgi:hypothetical protein